MSQGTKIKIKQTNTCHKHYVNPCLELCDYCATLQMKYSDVVSTYFDHFQFKDAFCDLEVCGPISQEFLFK